MAVLTLFRRTRLLTRLPALPVQQLPQFDSQGHQHSTSFQSEIPHAAVEAVKLALGNTTTGTGAAAQLASSLTPAQRAMLAAACAQGTSEKEKRDDAYIQELFEQADNDGDVRLSKNEFEHALALHRALEGQANRDPPNWSALRMVFIAAAIPFVGFGFLDNFIMLVAGEEIDEVFGRRLGLSTLASAGLGNLVADVIGVGAANGIEARVKRMPFIRDFKLSKHQTAMPSVKMTKAIGATVGVALGCVCGLAPLFYHGTFWVPGGRM